MTSVPLHPRPMRWIRVRMRSIVARQSMLSRPPQALRKQRKGGPENGTENRPEIGPAGQFHRQCVEPLRCPDCGVYRRFFAFGRAGDPCTREAINAQQHSACTQASHSKPDLPARALLCCGHMWLGENDMNNKPGNRRQLWWVWGGIGCGWGGVNGVG